MDDKARAHERDVRSTYERIGTHFAETRHTPWPDVQRFLDDRSGDIGLDIGVGNGRHAELLANRVEHVIGVDLSMVVLEEARRRALSKGFDVNLCLANAADLPLAAASVDLGVFIATLHHLAPRSRRLEGLNELARVLRPDATALVSVWSVSHHRFDRDRGFDTTIDWTLPDGTTVDRFYHIYTLGEFRADLAHSHLDVIESFENHGNCFAVVQGT